MDVPLVDLRAEYLPYASRINERIEEIFRSMNLFLGDNVQAFEREFAAYCGTRYGLGVASGTDALHLALRACGVGPGDEVITVAMTFFATTEAILHAGARPVYVDVDKETLCMDVDQLETRITPRTRAIVPVHLYGQMVDMDALLQVARPRGISVIEDACQAHGATDRGRRAGSLGDVGCFSFYFTKNLGAYGEGGFCTTEGEDLARAIALLRNHGHVSKAEHAAIGFNSRLDEIQAAILRIKLADLDPLLERREQLAAAYIAALEGLPLTWPRVRPGTRSARHLLVARTPERERLLRHLQEGGVGAAVHYRVPNHLQPAVRDLGYSAGDLPVTEEACRQVLSLPFFPRMSEEQMHYVVGKVRDYFGAAPL